MPRDQTSSDLGCLSSLTGALVFGFFLPVSGCNYYANKYNDMGGPLFWPAVMVVGFVFGAVAGPVCVFVIGWLVSRFTGGA